MAPVEDAPVLTQHSSYQSTASLSKPAAEPDAKDAPLAPAPEPSKAVPQKLLKRYNLAYAVTTFGVRAAALPC